MTVEAEKTIVYKLIAELNGLYDLGLDSEPVIDRLSETSSKKMKFLVIGGSHALREGKCLSERGYDVITCAVGGWRANKTAVEDMTEKVKEALLEIAEDDIIVVHCFDNVAFMSRSEEGGDLPIRRYPDGVYHVEGDLVLASKERIHMYFKNCLPFLQLLEGRKVVFLTPMPRYLRGCCLRSDHAPNRFDEGFEDQLRKGLVDCRGYFKDFLFTSGLRGFSILNPGLCLPAKDEDGAVMMLWGLDPVHPLKEGYTRIADSICEAAYKLGAKSEDVRKRAGSLLGPPGKKPRLEVTRPRWVEEEPPASMIHGGQQYGRGGGRGRGAEAGRGRPPWFYRPMRRGYF
jgi:hypothetical protein